jgi:hypothetical protein
MRWRLSKRGIEERERERKGENAVHCCSGNVISSLSTQFGREESKEH